MNSRSIMILMVLAVSLFGCDIKEPTTCLTGSEKCENDPVGNSGTYYVCGQDGEWSTEIRCNRGCAGDFKRCSDHSSIPHCEENTIKCSQQTDYDIAFKCHHQQWIPEICQPGSCTDGSGCIQPSTVCSGKDTLCYDVDNIGSLEVSCKNGNWLMNYCNNSLTCSGSRCTDESLLNCGGVNCQAQPGWETGSCDADKCVPSLCKKEFHFYTDATGNVICEENTNDHCGEARTPCQPGEICDTETGQCIDHHVGDECTDASQCGGGKVCEEGRCVECRQNEEKCDLDSTEHGQHYTCLETGKWSEPETCEYGCDNNHCKEAECTEALPCPVVGEICEAGRCLECRQNAEKCDLDTTEHGQHYTCLENGKWSEPETCKYRCDGDHCAEFECTEARDCAEREVCENRTCVPVTDQCTPGSSKCEYRSSDSMESIEYFCDENYVWKQSIICPIGCDGNHQHCVMPEEGTKCDYTNIASICIDSKNGGYELTCNRIDENVSIWQKSLCQIGCDDNHSHCYIPKQDEYCGNSNISSICIDNYYFTDGAHAFTCNIVTAKWEDSFCPNGCDGDKCKGGCTAPNQVLPECTYIGAGVYYGICMDTSEGLKPVNIPCSENDDTTFVCSEKTGYCAACKPGYSRCITKNDISYVQTCSNDEYWVSKERCEYGCIVDADGTAYCRTALECKPNEKRCNGNSIQTCSSEGFWDTFKTCEANELCSAYSDPVSGESNVFCKDFNAACIDGQYKCNNNTDNVGIISTCKTGQWEEQNSCTHGASCKSDTECGNCHNIPGFSCDNSSEEGEPAIISFCYEGETVEIECHTSSCSDSNCLTPIPPDCRNDINTQIGYIIAYENNTLTKTRCENSASCPSTADSIGCGVCLNGTTKCESLKDHESCNGQTCISKFSTCENGQWVEELSPNSCIDDTHLGDCENTPVTCVDDGNIGIIRGCINGKSVNKPCNNVSCSGVECGDCINGDFICGTHASSHAIATQKCVDGKYIVEEFCKNGCGANGSKCYSE